MGCYADLIIVVVFKFRLVYLQKVSATIGFDKRKIKKKNKFIGYFHKSGNYSD